MLRWTWRVRWTWSVLLLCALPLPGCAPGAPPLAVATRCPDPLWPPEPVLAWFETLDDGTEEGDYVIRLYDQQNALEKHAERRP